MTTAARPQGETGAVRRGRARRAVAALAAAVVLGALGLWFVERRRDDALVAECARADDAALRARPALVAERYALMAGSAVSFYRGSIGLFRRDWIADAGGLARSRFAAGAPRPFGVGDPHVENFGTLVGRDGALSLEPDDLDGAERVPLLWDVRRLAVGLVLVARAANPHDPVARRASAAAARDVAREAARAYAAALGDPPPAPPEHGALLDDLLARARRAQAARSELAELTVLTPDGRRLRRGGLSRENPARRLEDLDPGARATLPAALADYRATLADPPPEAFFTVLDAARQFGRGAGSYARLRVLVLVRGPTDAPDDDVIVEVKPSGEAIAPGGNARDALSRVLAARGALWRRPDADWLWGGATWAGCPVLVRAEAGGARSFGVSRMTGDRGTPAALRELARLLGAELGRIHRRTLPATVRSAIAGGAGAFADEQADAAVRYAGVVTEEWRRFQRLRRERGATLGLTGDGGALGPCELLDRGP
jgi:uncharacterized protein (DUF2252 family)